MDTNKIRFYRRKLMCATTGLSYNDPAPHTFSFNSPQGACPHCDGLGVVDEIDIEKIIPDQKLSIKNGAIKPLGSYRKNLIFCKLEAVLAKFGHKIETPFAELSAPCFRQKCCRTSGSGSNGSWLRATWPLLRCFFQSSRW